MDEPVEDRVRDLFEKALALTADRRPAFLDDACRDDPALRAEVEDLLACDSGFDGDDEGLLNSPLVRLNRPDRTAAPEVPGGSPFPTPARLGSYRIVRRIAEGGMGAVYEAEQDSPRRTVALKVVRPDLTSEALLRRFGHEARILGHLHHPGIAQVYESGLAADGQPFFAMEYIRGLALDEYVETHALDLPTRVALVARVCDAVQHAHDSGVVHRDLKPSNILVDEEGQPKVLDFGVARVTGADLLTAAGLTHTGQLLGTPSYMSPEQVSGTAPSLDGRADIYALGVILYELTARRLPLRLEGRPLAEAARMILEQEPPALGSIVPELRGDVETIVAKAMEKDPSRRYRSAAELAADLRRWLAHEPILARPPSAFYQLSKFARRNKALVGGVIATGFSLVLGLVGTTLFALAEAQQRSQAERNAREAMAGRSAAMFEAYRARLSAAAAAVSAHDVAGAARQLDAAPMHLRGWEWHHLRSRLDDSTAVISLPVGGGGVLIPGEKALRVGIPEGDGLRLTDLEGANLGKVSVPLRNPRTVIAAETRDGLRVVRWDGSGFSLFDEAGRRVGEMVVPGGTQPRVAIDHDGTRLAWPRLESGGARLRFGELAAGKPILSCEGHIDNIWAFAFSPDGTRLLSGGEDRTAKLWDRADGSLLATCRGHTNKVLGVAFSPDGKRLLTTSSDGTVRQWDAANGQEVEAPYDRHSGEVTVAVYSPDGRRVASAGSDRTVRVWEAKGRHDLAVLHGHTGNITGLAFTPDGLRLASLSRDSMLSIAGDHTARSWDVDPVATLPVLQGHNREIYPVAFSPDGRWIASGAWDGTARLWDAFTGEPCATLPHPGVVRCLAFGRKNDWLVCGGDGEDALRVWDVATGRVRARLPLQERSARFLTVDCTGDRIAASLVDRSDRHTWLVCDAVTGRELFSEDGSVLAYSPDGRFLATLDPDHATVVLRDAREHRVLARWTGHERGVASATFSADGALLASCGADRSVRVWRTADGKCRTFRGHPDEIFAVAFHPDGTRLASAGRDRAIWLWDLARSEEVIQLQGHTGFIWSLAFSPDGTTLASGSGDKTVRLWDVAPLRNRHRARREAVTLRPEAERLVDQLQRTTPDPAAIAEALRHDPGIGDPLRQAAIKCLLLRSIASGPPACEPRTAR